MSERTWELELLLFACFRSAIAVDHLPSTGDRSDERQPSEFDVIKM